MSNTEVVAIVRAELADHDGMEDVVVDWTGDRIVLSGEVSSDELAQLAEQIVGDPFGLRVENRLRVLPTLRELPGALAQPESKVPDLEGQPLFRSTAPVDERTDAGETGEPFTPPDVPPPEPRK
jgi:hypothetical protein